MNLKIILKIHNNAEYIVSVNDTELPHADTILYEFNPEEQTSIKIKHVNKNESDTIVRDGVIISDKAIELVSIQFDDYKIPDTVLYNIPYKVSGFTDVVRDLPDEVLNTLYFGFNGVYEIKFKNFYEWYYTELVLAEERAHTDSSLVKYGKSVQTDDVTNISIHDLEELIQ